MTAHQCVSASRLAGFLLCWHAGSLQTARRMWPISLMPAWRRTLLRGLLPSSCAMPLQQYNNTVLGIQLQPHKVGHVAVACPAFLPFVRLPLL